MSDILSQIDPVYASDQMDLQRRMALSQALREQSLSSLGPTQSIGGVAIRQSPWQGIAKLTQALAANYMDKNANQDRSAAAQRHAQFLSNAFDQTYGTGQPQQQQSAPIDAAGISQAPGSVTNNVVSDSLQNMPQSQGGNLPTPQPNPNQPVIDALMKKAKGAYLMGNTDLSNKLMENVLTMTNEQKNMAAMGQDPFQQGQLSTDASLQKTGGMHLGLDGVVRQYPGYSQANAGMKGAEAGAVEAGKLPYASPSMVNTQQGPRLMTPTQQIQAANSTGGLPLQTPSSVEIEKAKTDAAIGLTKAQSAAEPLLQIIQQAKQLAPSVPYGSMGIAEGKAKFSGLPGVNHEAANNAAIWEQQMGQNILSTIQQLVASGGIRMDIPIVKEIQKAGGIPLSLPPEGKLRMLNQLESEVRNKISAAGNIVPGLNNADINNTVTQPMVNPQPVGYTQTATNPQTGQKIGMRNGQWEPIK